MLEQLLTEQANPASAAIDTVGTEAALRIINREDAKVAEAVEREIPAIARAVDAIADAIGRGGRLFYAGAGPSGRLGVLDASEIPPTFGAPPELVQGIIAGGPAALTRSQEGAEDRPEGARDDLDMAGVRAGDFVIGIAASGTTPYVRAALQHAKRLGARTAIIACSPPPANTLAAADIAIVVLTGPEVVTGSTRMKAGTATKLVLNTITTGAMIRLGKTYGNLMVDLQASNAKLPDRAERIVREVCGVTGDEARDLLRAADGSVKLAIVMQKLDVDAPRARTALEREGGF